MLTKNESKLEILESLNIPLSTYRKSRKDKLRRIIILFRLLVKIISIKEDIEYLCDFSENYLKKF